MKQRTITATFLGDCLAIGPNEIADNTFDLINKLSIKIGKKIRQK